MNKAIIVVIAITLIFGISCLNRQPQSVDSAISSVNGAAAEESRIVREMTEEDIKLILFNEQLLAPPLSIEELKKSEEKRKEYLEQLRGTLALAAQAQKEGLATKPDFEILRRFGEKATLAYIYPSKEKDAKPLHDFVKLTKEEIQEFYKNPKNEEIFNLEINAQLAARHALYVAENKGDANIPVPTLNGDSIERARDRWARAAIVAEKAKADAEFMQKREVQLQLKLQEARLLASQYSSLHVSSKIEPTSEEIAQYLALHPEYDVNKKREKAEMILQRAKAGENFAALVKEFNEQNKDEKNRGFYKNVDESMLPIEIKEVALTLEKGQVAERLIETVDGYHIVKLEDRKVEKDATGKEKIKFTLGLILVRNKFQAPTKNANLPAPFEEAGAIAKDALRIEKGKQIRAELAERNGIKVPPDFTI